MGPKLPKNLFITGSDISIWNSDTLTGTANEATTIPGVSPGARITINRLKTGVFILGVTKDILNVHYSQIASVAFIEAAKVKEEKKSVVGRALVGGILLGPLGAVVGGMSGVGANRKPIDGMSLTFWSINQAAYMSLVIESAAYGVSGFVSSLEKYIKPYADLHQATAI